MTSAAAPAWRLRAIGDAGFEWTYRLHEAALGEHIEQIWGWDEELQPQMFTEAFHRQERQVIVVGADDVGVLAVEERPDELYLALLELLPAWQGKGLGAGTPMKLAPRSSTSSTTGATKPTKPSSWRRRTPRQPVPRLVAVQERWLRSMKSMDALVDVIDVAVIGDFRLRLRFRDGTVGDVGFEDREWRGVFEPLADPTFFARVSVDTECGTVTWPNGVEMAPEPALRGSAGQPRHGFFDELTRRLAAGAVAHRS